LEDKELDAYIESLIATVDDTTSETEGQVTAFPGDEPAGQVQQSDDDSGDESVEETEDKESDEDEEDVMVTLQAENAAIEETIPVLEEEEDSEESDEEEEEDVTEMLTAGNDTIDQKQGTEEEQEDTDESDEEEEEDTSETLEDENATVEQKNQVVEEDQEDDTDCDEESDEEEEECVSETLAAVDAAVEPKQDIEEEEEEDGENDGESDEEEEEDDDEIVSPTVENDIIEQKEVIEKALDGDSEDLAGMENDVAVENDPSSARSNETEPLARPLPPNPVYLFLLRRGIVGHVLAMGMVLVVEWIQTYLPTLARFLAWLWSRLAPTRLQQGAPLPRRRRRPNPPTLAQVSNPRTGRSGKQRKKLTKQADQQALAQLKRIGNVGDAKYRHVSMDFLQRHGLGPFSKADSPTRVDSIPLETGSSKTQDDAEEESDADWVVEALVKEKTDHQSKKPSIQPIVSLGVGSQGVSAGVGVEFSFGGGKQSKDRRTSLMTAAATATAPRKKRKVKRASDRDGGSGVVGRIRAVTGANSRVSRSLFGAYPGDAAPVEEAASKRGVVELARKYGYGDWSDDDDDRDDEGEVVKKHRRAKSRSRRKHRSRSDLAGDDSRKSSRTTISAEWKSSFSSGDRPKHTHTRRSGSLSKRADPDASRGNGAVASRQPSQSASRRVRPNHPLASSSVLGKKPGSSSAYDLAKVTTVRPAMARVRQVRRKVRSKGLKEDD
jgi:hypothetical protein